jgi:hypothetical protein
VQQVLAPAIVRILEALGHDLRGLELPEIDTIRPVAGEEQIQASVAVVIQPGCSVGIHPLRKADARGNEPASTVVVKQLGLAVAIEKEILPPVIVVVAPDRAHRDAGLAAVHICEANRRRDVFERAITLVAIQPVEASLAAIGDVEVLPSIAIEVSDRNRRAR